MECEQARQLQDPLFDGELGLERSLEVEAHIDSCPGCADAYRNLSALRSSLRERLPYNSASERLKRRLHATRLVPEMTPAWAPPQPNSRRAIAGALAFVCAVFAVVIFELMPAPRQQRSAAIDEIANEALSGHLRSLMANHLADVTSSDQHTVKPYFAGKLDFSPPVVDLAKFGFPLAAGRLDYMDGHPVAALVYHRNRHVINLFIWPAGAVRESAPATLSRRGYQIVHWTASGMTEWAVSDLNAVELGQLAEDLRQPH